ncbi:DNA repair protein [Streptomyces sp. F-3]|uniref:Non-homologous end joining protein Ku n=2 Tax=Streptomyces TaxID=1883 RepID=A0ABP4DDH7_9ACTN|nr:MULTISPECIES: Ku protein [Streptomyces]MDN5382440.1 Ku protein [Streptomyces sp. LB8]GAT80879.1 DNA repair protein [Streptomyces sp. F-3]
MRSIWNGAIAFGLLRIPIKVVNATENHTIPFRQIHTEDGSRIRYRKVCELEDREVTQAEIGKAYEDTDGTIIPITDEDLAHLPLSTTKTIDIVAFVPADRIDPLHLDNAYYLASSGVRAAKPYTLLREALKRSRRVAIAKLVLGGRERLCMLRVVDDVIAMHSLLWPDEIRAPQGVAPAVDVRLRDRELELADTLMDTLGEVDLGDLHDEYRKALEAVIAAKAAGEALPEAPEPAPDGKIVDLMTALERSVQAARQARGEPAEEGEDLSPRGPARAASRKQTSTARKTAAKKQTSEPARSAKKTAAATGKTTKKTPAGKAAPRKRTV